jgi:glutamyl-Q tRNA(Asp) synthetase
MIKGQKPVGRFAPSPTGELHFGSLVAAVGSYLYAKSSGGKWLLRIEDLDPDREVPLARDAIRRSLQAHGFEWDDPVLFQSDRSAAYGAALEQLRDRGVLFLCRCSRKALRQMADRLGLARGVYGGHCLRAPPQGRDGALRVRVPEGVLCFDDALLGPCAYDWQRDVGPFVVQRRDGLFAYQLAVVVDDAFSGVNQVVRGLDLLSSTPMQIALQQYLGFEQPAYAHLPLVYNAQGQKLSKQTGAVPLDNAQAASSLTKALKFLGQNPPKELAHAPVQTLWQWAFTHWDPARIATLKQSD